MAIPGKYLLISLIKVVLWLEFTLLAYLIYLKDSQFPAWIWITCLAIFIAAVLSYIYRCKTLSIENGNLVLNRLMLPTVYFENDEVTNIVESNFTYGGPSPTHPLYIGNSLLIKTTKRNVKITSLNVADYDTLRAQVKSKFGSKIELVEDYKSERISSFRLTVVLITILVLIFAIIVMMLN